jgi:hypothetical protein
VLIAVATTLVIAGVALVAFGHGKHHNAPASAAHPSIRSIIRDPNLKREVSYLAKVSSAVFQTPACRPAVPHVTSYINGSPGQDLLSILGVLRRPRTSGDAPAVRFAQQDPEIYRGYVRRALVADGVSYFIAAMRQSFTFALPARCLDREAAALRRELPRIPRSLRPPTIKLQAQMIAAQRKLRKLPTQSTICFGTATHNASDQMCGVTAVAIKHGIAPIDNRGTFIGVVPDGVATVTVRYKTAGGGEASLTGRVSGNMYAVRGPQDYGSSPLMTVVWRSAQGALIKKVTQPSPALLIHYCKREPHTCAGLQSATARSSSASMSVVAVGSLAPRATRKH